MSQDEKRRELERQASLGDEAAAEKLRALERRLLSAADADYLQEYLRLCDEVTQGTSNAPVEWMARLNRDERDGRARQRPPAKILADLEKLNKKFEKKVSSPRVLRKRLISLDAFREGVEIASWSSSTVDCAQNGSHDNDTYLFQYASSDGTEKGLPWRGGIREAYDEKRGYRERYPDDYRGREPLFPPEEK